MNLVAKTTTYEFVPDDIKKLIAESLKEEPKNVKVNFIIEEVSGDPMDRFPGRNEVTKINVTVNKT